MNRNTVNTYFNEFCVKNLKDSLKEHSKEFGALELNEGYFGACRVRGKRKKRRRQDTSFWLAKTKIIRLFQIAQKDPLIPVVQGKILESSIHTDGWSSYDGTDFEWLRPLSPIPQSANLLVEKIM